MNKIKQDKGSKPNTELFVERDTEVSERVSLNEIRSARFATVSRFTDLNRLKSALENDPDSLLSAVQKYEERPKFQSLFANLKHLSWLAGKEIKLVANLATVQQLKDTCTELINFLVDKRKAITTANKMTDPKPPRPADFEDIEDYVAAFKIYLTLAEITDGAKQSAHFQLAIASHKSWNCFVVAAVKENANINFETLTAKIIKSIKPESTQKIASVIMQMVNLSQREPTKKSLTIYYQKFQKLANQATDTDLSAKAKTALFIQNLQSASTIWGMYDEKDTLDSIYQKAQRITDSQTSIDIRYNRSQSNRRYPNRSSYSSSSRPRRPLSTGCGYCKDKGKPNWMGHPEKNCFSKKGWTDSANRGKVGNREKFNSIVSQLSDLMNDDEVENEENNMDENSENGSDMEDESTSSQECGLGGSQRINLIYETISNTSETSLIPLKMTRTTSHGQKRRFCAKLDTGASRSCVKYSHAISENMKITQANHIRVKGFDGTISKAVKGLTKLKLKIGGQTANVVALVVDGLQDNLIGMDVLKDFPGEMYKKSGKMRFRFFEEDRIAKVYASERTVIPPLSTSTITIKKLDCWNSKQIMLTSNEKQRNFTTPNAVTDNNCTKILLVNVTDKPYTVKAGQQVAEVGAVVEDSGQFSKDTGNPNKISEEEYEKLVEDKLAHLLPQPEKYQKAKDILMRNQRYFDKRADKEVGKYVGQQINLNPTNKTLNVKKQKRRIFPEVVWQKANGEMDILHRNGLIEESEFATISPANIVLAQRAGSDRPRLCIDYKMLNLELVDCFHVTESLESIMMRIGKFEVLSNLDLSSAYWNLELTENSRDLTAFYGQDRVYRWRRLPFGIKSGSQWMQKILSSIILEKSFQDSLGVYSVCSLFVDDLLISGFWEDHFDDLEKVIQKLGKMGFILKFSKSNFFQKSLKFLGIKISAPGVMEMDDEFTEGLDKIRLPETTKEVRAFLGIFNWRANFLDHFFDLAEPLYALLKGTTAKKNEKVELQSVHIESIKKCIQAAKKATKLALPQFGKDAPPFEIETDASSVGFGACLKQGQKVIAYASKSLSSAGRNYENSHRELASLMWAVQKFNRFIVFASKKTIVYTDNKIVSFLKNATNSKLVRWRTQLAGYNLDIRHRKGKDMKIADPLSRLLKVDPDEKEDAGLRKMQDEIVVAFAQEEINLLQESVSESLAENNEKSKNVSKNPDEDKISEIAEVFGLHYKEGHCKPKRLLELYPHLRSESFIRSIVEKCPNCVTNEPVKKILQIPGTTFADPENTGKNSKWYLDFVFPKITGPKKVVLSILDRDTDYYMAKEVGNREHKKMVKALDEIFTKTGVPKVISADREFDSEIFDDLAKKHGFVIELLPRESPHVNLVERKHKDLKDIWALNKDWSLNEVVTQMNRFKKIGGIKTKYSPYDLFTMNLEKEIQDFRNIRVIESEKRTQKLIKLRGRNVKVFEKSFQVGDLVKFGSLLNKYDIKFGKVIKMKSKFVSVQKLNSKKTYTIHAEKLKKLPKSYESLLNNLLR